MCYAGMIGIAFSSCIKKMEKEDLKELEYLLKKEMQKEND